MASALYNSTWLPWTVKEIMVFDHETVMESNCTIRMDYFGTIKNSNDSIGFQINITLMNCYGAGELRITETGVAKSKKSLYFQQELVSLGNHSQPILIFANDSCNVLQALVNFTSPRETIIKKNNITSLTNLKACQNYSPGTNNSSNGNGSVQNSTTNTSNSAQDSLQVIIYGTLNPIVAVFFVLIFFIYFTNGVLAYRGYKDLLKPLQNLTNPEDEYTYEVQIQVGSGFSTQSSQCKVMFTAFGTDDVIGPVSLPGSSFEHDGIASFLISTSKKVGDIGTIGLFCSNMDPRSDLFLRLVKIFRHSQKPNGNHWGENDVIKKVAEFDCHSWFSPTIRSHSVGQVFNRTGEQYEKSLLVEYISRCSQLFFQKHILTTWRCSFGVQSFTKAQRLAFFFTMWFFLIYLTTLFIAITGIKDLPNEDHMYQIGIIRLDKKTSDFSVSTAFMTYLAGLVLFLVAKTVYGVSDKEGYGNRRHIQVDSTRLGYQNAKHQLINDETGISNDKCLHTASKDAEEAYTNGVIEFDGSSEPNGTSQILSENEMSMRNGDRAGNLYGSTQLPMSVDTEGSFKENYGQPDNALHAENVVLDVENYSEGRKKTVAVELGQEELIVESNGHLERPNGSGKINGGFNYLSVDSTSCSGKDSFETNELMETEKEKGPVEVQFFNRETIVVGKENLLKSCAIKFSSRLFWIVHSVFLMFCTFHTLIVSTDWNADTSFHWISMHVVSLVISCFFLDTVRVLGYILSITLKERKELKAVQKRTTFEKYAKLLQASKLAEKERNSFCQKEYSEDRMKIVQNYYRLRGKFRELFLFLTFVIVLLINTTWTMNQDSFRFWGSLRNFALNTDELENIQSAGNTVDPAVNFWTWANKTLPPLLDVKKRDVSLQQLYLLGQAIILTQRRVKKGRCSLPKQMEQLVEDCSAEFHIDHEDRQAYSPRWKRFEQGTNATNGIQGWQWLESQVQGIDAKGYRVRFMSFNVNETINHLMKTAWIDRYTRRLALQMLVYNPSANLIASVDIHLSFSNSGSIQIVDKFFNFVFSQELSPRRVVTHLSETTLFMITVYLIFDIVRRKKRTSMSWLSGWLILQIIVIVLSIVVISMTIYRHHLLYLLGIKSTILAKADIIFTIMSTSEVFEFLLANLSALSFVLLLKPLFTLGLFDDMYIAIVRTVSDLKGIATETIIILIGFGCWANLAFTSEISSFSTMDLTFATLMDMLVRPDQTDLYDVPLYGPLFVFVYFAVMVFLVSNLVISSVEQSYSEARRLFDSMKRKTVFKVLMKKLKKKKLGAAAAAKEYDLTLRSTMSRNPAHVSSKNTENNKTEATLGSEDFADGTSGYFEKQESNKQEELPDQTDVLLAAINRIEQVVWRKVIFEHASDNLLVAAFVSQWDRHVLKKPPLDVTSIYKPLIRKPRTDLKISKSKALLRENPGKNSVYKINSKAFSNDMC
eukprot:gene588-10279_t